MIPEWKDVAGRDPDNNNEKIAASRARTSPAPTPALSTGVDNA